MLYYSKELTLISTTVVILNTCNGSKNGTIMTSIIALLFITIQVSEVKLIVYDSVRLAQPVSTQLKK